MDQFFLDTIYLFSCGARGIKPVLDHEPDIQKIHDAALLQGIWDITFFAIKELCGEGKHFINSEIIERWHKEPILRIVKETQRSYQVHNIIKKLESSGINCCVLKGETIADLYHIPNCRISSDTDILIDIKNKHKAIRVLTESGFNIDPINPISHHIVATHPVAGVVELHLQLYDELFEDVWFDKKISNEEPYRKIKTQDGFELITLGVTDGLIFITLHYIKHFLTRGVGIRQLMDILLYMKQYKNRIDWGRFNRLMEHLKYKKFMENSIGIGVKYMNFKEEDLPSFSADDSLMLAILSDIEKGGVFGKNESGRKGFYLTYTKARSNASKKGIYNVYVRKLRILNIMKVIFPRYTSLKQKYTYIDKHLLLYPIAWIHRFVLAIISLVKDEKSLSTAFNPDKAASENEIIKKRMELIKNLDMI